MIDKKLINFKKEADFLTQKEAGNIKDTSVVFIDDVKKIVTHDTEFDCSGSESDWETLKNKPFGEKSGVNYVAKEQTLTMSTPGTYTKGFSTNYNVVITEYPKLGDKCKVIIDDKEYEATVREINNKQLINRLVLSDAVDEELANGEPYIGNWAFCYAYNGKSKGSLYLRASVWGVKPSTLTVINTTSDKVIVKLDPKYYNEGGFTYFENEFNGNVFPRVQMLNSNSVAVGNYSVAEGYATVAEGYASHSEGYITESKGQYSHVEGYQSKAISDYSHSEGYNTQAKGNASHSEGYTTSTIEDYSHAEGFYSKATGLKAHAEGDHTIASGIGSHAEGWQTTANGNYSHTEGIGTETNNSGEHASGQYNVSNSNTLFTVGNGRSEADRHNAFEIKQNGDIYISDTNAAGEYYEKPMIKLQDALNKVTPDWLATEIEEGFIKNKPFGENYQVCFDGEIVFNNYSQSTYSTIMWENILVTEPILGETYIIELDGKSWELTAFKNSDNRICLSDNPSGSAGWNTVNIEITALYSHNTLKTMIYYKDNRALYNSKKPVHFSVIQKVTDPNIKLMPAKYLPIVQTTGDSETLIMTQKAVTDALANITSDSYDDTELRNKVTALEAIDHSKYLTQHQSLEGYYTKEEVDSIINTLVGQINTLLDKINGEVI